MSNRTIKTCSIDGCETVVQARGWCSKHYQRWQRYGHPLKGGFFRTTPTSPFCKIEECGEPVKARGWCEKHYQRWHKHGDPFGGNRNYSSPEESFAARTKAQGECIIWTGSINDSGYGKIWDGKQTVRAHRYAWERVNGPIPEGMFIDHRCHNPACVKVAHLRLASQSENNAHRSGPTSVSRSGIRNVYPYRNKWRVAVGKGGILHEFGKYSDIDEAAEVAEKARRELFGEFAGRG